MAFSEAIKLEVKRQAHFTCCWCRNPLLKVDIHHVVPQADGGVDGLDNAAPLCGGCHTLLGNNPDLRKEIRLRRDQWYELCAARTSDRGDEPPAPRIAISKLPATSEHFVAREDELAFLDRAWDDEATNVVSLVALGGVGKTALVNAWLDRLEGDGWRGADRVLGWSFYSQGTDATGASGDAFVEHALRWLGYDGEPIVSPWQKGVELASRVRAARTLLVLDGLEPCGRPRTSPNGATCCCTSPTSTSNGRGCAGGGTIGKRPDVTSSRRRSWSRPRAMGGGRGRWRPWSGSSVDPHPRPLSRTPFTPPRERGAAARPSLL